VSTSNIVWEYWAATGMVLDEKSAKVCEAANPEDGKLIAAAPDLLVAAKRALRVLKAQGESTQPGNVLWALNEALKKAGVSV